MFYLALLELKERLEDQIIVAALTLRCVAPLNTVNDVLDARLEKTMLFYACMKVKSPRTIEVTPRELGIPQRSGQHLLKSHIGGPPLKIVLQASRHRMTYCTYRQESLPQLPVTVEETTC
jgi:hypothetical protein